MVVISAMIDNHKRAPPPPPPPPISSSVLKFARSKLCALASTSVEYSTHSFWTGYYALYYVDRAPGVRKRQQSLSLSF